MITLDEALSIAKATKKDIGDRLFIGLYRFGGAGDTLILGGLARKIKEKYPDAYIQAHIRNNKDILASFSAIDSIVEWNWNSQWQSDVIKLNKEYDLFYDCRYSTKIFFNCKGHEAYEKEHIKAFKPYAWHYDHWLDSNTTLHELKKHVIEIIADCTCLDITAHDLQLPLLYDAVTTDIMGQGEYVTIHNWADMGRQTKMWQAENMGLVAEALASAGYKVYQLGGIGEDPIDHAVNYTGKLKWKQTATIIKHSKLHIDIEGGLIYLSTSYNTPSIVLCGPTPVECFGWKQNINIAADVCSPCWWSTPTWFTKCPKNYDPPVCMASITPEMVLEKARQALNNKKLHLQPQNDYERQYETDAEKLILDEAHYKAEPHQDERIKTMVSMAKGTCLEVGSGDGYMANLISQKGHPVDCVEISSTRIQRAKDTYGIQARKGDVRTLPLGDGKYDTVYAGEILEHIDNMHEGLKELERVCSKKGQIIVSLPVSEEHDLYHLHKWAVRMTPIQKNGKTDMIVLQLRRINR